MSLFFKRLKNHKYKGGTHVLYLVNRILFSLNCYLSYVKRDYSVYNMTHIIGSASNLIKGINLEFSETNLNLNNS